MFEIVVTSRWDIYIFVDLSIIQRFSQLKCHSDNLTTDRLTGREIGRDVKISPTCNYYFQHSPLIISRWDYKIKLHKKLSLQFYCHSSITVWTPALLRRCWNASLAKTFVKMSTICSFDLQNSKNISLLFTNSLMKWYLVSMCLVFLWNTWFFDNMMDELLLQNTVVGSYFCCKK